jgi:D-arabinose 1-dehydrogenase-like Zn-dependent alcohol dehydrogenase
VPTIQLVLGEITVVGNLIGTNSDLTDLIALAQQGKVVLHSTRYPWKPPTTRSTTSATAGSALIPS